MVWAPNTVTVLIFCTPCTQGVIWSATAAANYPAGTFAQNLESIPARRVGSPEEVCVVTCELCRGVSLLQANVQTNHHTCEAGCGYGRGMW